jgi:hypothetical protein
LAFDLCVLARQLSIAEDLARACDGMPLVLDHCGVPDIAGGAFEPWAQGIDALARLPHVHCKISGLTAYAAPGATTETIRPWVDHVLERFGPDRCLWGGDWPVVNLGAGLPAWIVMTRELLANLSRRGARARRHRHREGGVPHLSGGHHRSTGLRGLRMLAAHHTQPGDAQVEDPPLTHGSRQAGRSPLASCRLARG